MTADKSSIQLLEAIAETVIESIQKQMIIIGLKDSNIIKSITYKINSNNYTILFSMPFYYSFIESGRNPLTKKIPVLILIKWMKRKRIAVGKETKIAWAIQQSIYNNGIKARPFLQKALNDAHQEVYEIMSINLSNIIDNIIKQF